MSTTWSRRCSPPLTGLNQTARSSTSAVSDPTRLREFVDILLAVVGGGSYACVPFPEDRRRIDIGSYYADYSKIKSVLDWQPAVPLAEGLRRTVEYYRRYRNHYW